MRIKILTIICSIFLATYSFAAIEIKINTKDTIQIAATDTACEKQLMKSAKSALKVGLIFIAPASFLGGTFLAKGSQFTTAAALTLAKSGAVLSLVIALISIVSYLILMRKKKKKDCETKRHPFWERLLMLGILSVGIISIITVFSFSLSGGLGILLKILNLISGITLLLLGSTFLFKKKYKN